MILDTSALIAILFREADAESFARALTGPETRAISAATFVETAMVAEGRGGPPMGHELDLLLSEAEIEVRSLDRRQATLAREAWRRYGKGRHPAALNLGDCFAYALAKHLDEPLLFKGTDFSQTDVKRVL